MRALRRFLARLANSAMARRHDQRLNAEIEEHLALQTDENLRAGLSPAEARRQAVLKFGAVEAIKETYRAERRFLFLESLWQDVRYAARTLRKSPDFAAVAILTLALGIGANTAIFSAVNSIFLKPLPYPNSSQLVELQTSDMEEAFPYPDLLRIRAESRTLGPMALHTSGPRPVITGAGAPQRVNVHDVSADFFPLFGVQPLYGRWLLPSEMQAGNDRVVVLSYSLWRDSFGSDPHAVGRTIMLQEHAGLKPYTVVGVMPPQFDFPPADLPEHRIQIWAPMVPTQAEMSGSDSRFFAVARIKPGYTLRDVQTELGVIASRLRKTDPAAYKSVSYTAASVRDQLVLGYGSIFMILLAAVGFVLLIACASLANLSLARGLARGPELALRATLGATRGRIVRQLFVESLLLASAGGVGGLLLAFWGVAALRVLLSDSAPRLNELAVDHYALWFTLAVSLVAAILFGLMPALVVSPRDPNAAMKEGISRSSGALGSRRGRSLRDLLVMGEVALAFVLVLGAALTLRSLSEVLSINPGVRTGHLLRFYVPRPMSIPPQAFDGVLFSRQLVQTLRQVPGAQAVAASDGEGMGWHAVHVQGIADSDLPSRPAFSVESVTPGYFGTLGLPLQAGRDFADTDTQSSPLVAIASHEFARQYFGTVNPVGRRVVLRNLDPKDRAIEKPCQIVGEVGDVNLISFLAPQEPFLYLDYEQYPQDSSPRIALRAAGDPLLLESAIRAQVFSLWKDDPVEGMSAVDQDAAWLRAGERSRAALLGAFGALGLLLAAIGIYGVMSYSVTQRTHEIGIRVALGALPGDIMRLIVGQGARVAFIGIAFGLAGAWALTQFLRVLSVLIDGKQAGPLVFAAVAFVLAAVALLACYIPARRAMRVDPLIALRHE